MSPKSGPKRLRELLKQPGIIRSLGAHDVFTALIVQQAGFETVFIGGFGTSASMLGLPDLNFLTMSEMADAVRRMAARVCIPVIADGDTGYGDLHNVQRTVEAFEAAGASGILLEDQVMPKRCGHFANKRVIPSEEMVLKIKAAVKAKSDPDFVIFARTDARQMNTLDDAIDRVNRCCDSGADIAFIEAPESRAELEEIPKRVQAKRAACSPEPRGLRGRGGERPFSKCESARSAALQELGIVVWARILQRSGSGKPRPTLVWCL